MLESGDLIRFEDDQDVPQRASQSGMTESSILLADKESIYNLLAIPDNHSFQKHG